MQPCKLTMKFEVASCLGGIVESGLDDDAILDLKVPGLVSKAGHFINGNTELTRPKFPIKKAAKLADVPLDVLGLLGPCAAVSVSPTTKPAEVRRRSGGAGSDYKKRQHLLK